MRTLLRNAFAELAGRSKEDDQVIRRELEQRYACYALAFQQKDARGITAMFAPEFRLTPLDQTPLERDAASARILQQMRRLCQIRQMRVQVNAIQVEGDRAVVSLVETIESSGVNGSGQVGSGQYVDAVQDTWIKTERGWKLAASQTRSATWGRWSMEHWRE